MLSINQNPIVDYGVAYAFDFYTLSELVKNQLKKGFQPYNSIFQAQHPDGMQYCQALVKYAPLAKAKKNFNHFKITHMKFQKTIHNHYYATGPELRQQLLLIIKQNKQTMEEMQQLQAMVDTVLGKTKTLQASVDAKQDVLLKAFSGLGDQITTLKTELAKPQIDPAAIAKVTDELSSVSDAIQAATDDVDSTATDVAAPVPVVAGAAVV